MLSRTANCSPQSSIKFVKMFMNFSEFTETVLIHFDEISTKLWRNFPKFAQFFAKSENVSDVNQGLRREAFLNSARVQRALF